jgi:hypothetical protein
MRQPIFLEVNHRLESRMQEICLSGSEGGAKPTLSLPLSHPDSALGLKWREDKEDLGCFFTPKGLSRRELLWISAKGFKPGDHPV